MLFYGAGAKCPLRRVHSSVGQKRAQKTLAFESSSVYSAFMEVLDFRGDIIRHMWPVELTSHVSKHTQLARVAQQSQILFQLEKV